jgi:transcriptional regulator with XRE-family HTH domain
MRFGERLIQLRKEKKISQEQLAEDLGVTRQTISNWENYKNYPDIAMLTMISDRYKISLDDLLKKDVDYVKKIDKQIKWGKKNKIILHRRKYDFIYINSIILFNVYI